MPQSFDYDNWNSKKQVLNQTIVDDVYFREREVWWCSIGLNVGFEENGKGQLFNRPVLILKKCGSKTFIGIPVSTTKRRGNFYYPIELDGRPCVCLLTHIRLFDSRRLTEKVVTLKEIEFQLIRKSLKDLI
jgi:mRNA-degrading endonuclease toxin of MazEF toxin-antitoxin module